MDTQRIAPLRTLNPQVPGSSPGGPILPRVWLGLMHARCWPISMHPLAEAGRIFCADSPMLTGSPLTILVSNAAPAPAGQGPFRERCRGGPRATRSIPASVASWMRMVLRRSPGNDLEGPDLRVKAPDVKGYGEFCPVAQGAEIFAGRWTPLIVRRTSPSTLRPTPATAPPLRRR